MLHLFIKALFVYRMWPFVAMPSVVATEIWDAVAQTPFMTCRDARVIFEFKLQQ